MYYLSGFGLNKTLCIDLENTNDSNNTSSVFLISINVTLPSFAPIATMLLETGLQDTEVKPQPSFSKIPYKV